MRKFYLTIFILLFIPLSIFSQTYKISMLENKLKTSKGVERIKILNELSQNYLDVDAKKSVIYAEEAFDISKKQTLKPVLLAEIYNNLGSSYYYTEKYRKSLKYYESELDLLKTYTDDKNISKAYYNIGVLYEKTGRTTKAILNFGFSLSYAQKINSYDLMLKNHKALYLLYKENNNNKEALNHLQYYVSMKDDKFYKTNKRVNILRKKYIEEREMRQNAEYTAAEKDSALSVAVENEIVLRKDTSEKAGMIDLLTVQNDFNRKLNLQKSELNNALFELKNAEIQRREAESIYLGFILFVLVSGSVWLLYLYRQKIRAHKLLAESKEEIVTQADIIYEKNREITDSINYARRIQDSLLIPEDKIKEYLPNAFIFYQPKDIVSGDFYWFSKVKDELVLAAIDCTGHGVPGAFMSMIGHTLLNEIVNEKQITKPDEILRLLHLGVMAALQQTGNDSASDDGMDMSLCTINLRQKRFRFAGAKNHLYVLQKDNLKVLKANNHSVGGRPIRSDIKVEFSSYDFMYDVNTTIYMLSDGYMDQFGGLQDTKFNSKRFKELLMKNRNLPMSKQKEIIQNTFSEWKGNRSQVDDILVLGVKLD